MPALLRFDLKGSQGQMGVTGVSASRRIETALVHESIHNALSMSRTEETTTGLQPIDTIFTIF
jgi:hypothetical protein